MLLPESGAGESPPAAAGGVLVISVPPGDLPSRPPPFDAVNCDGSCREAPGCARIIAATPWCEPPRAPASVVAAGDGVCLPGAAAGAAVTRVGAVGVGDGVTLAGAALPVALAVRPGPAESEDDADVAEAAELERVDVLAVEGAETPGAGSPVRIASAGVTPARDRTAAAGQARLRPKALTGRRHAFSGSSSLMWTPRGGGAP